LGAPEYPPNPKNNPQSKSDTKAELDQTFPKVCESGGMPQQRCPFETKFAGQVEGIFNESLSERA
jgi:hypothetical protein